LHPDKPLRNELTVSIKPRGDRTDPANRAECALPAPRAELHDQEPELPSARIDPHRVADAILNAATEQPRDIEVGAMSNIDATTAKLVPARGKARRDVRESSAVRAVAVVRSRRSPWHASERRH
jgi:hypothetical protein